MSNTRRLPGTVPAGLSATGQEVPPSADVAERSLAEVIGQAVALHLAQLLAPLLQQAQAQPACVLCVQACKVAEQNARQAAEEFSAPGIAQAVTWMPVGSPPAAVPLCYGHVPDGPQVRATGLVSPSGAPIVARQG